MKIAVYTCITGGYDQLVQPLVTDSDFDFICFRDSLSCGPECDGVWRFVDFQCPETDPVLVSRWPKMHPELLLPEYDYSLWMDGNIAIASPQLYDRVRELADSSVLYAGVRHPHRDDVREEAERVLAGGRDSLKHLLKVLYFLDGQKFPRHYGMMENCVILRRHSDTRIVEFDALWAELFSRFPRRDQMTHGYCLWKTGLVPELILPAGENVRCHFWFKYSGHGPVYSKSRSVSGRWRDFTAALKLFLLRLFLVGK